MSKNKFHHTERAPYQRENIDLALKIVIGIMSELGLDSTSYDPNKVFYVDSMGDFGGRNLNWGNRTEIDFRFSFNTKVHIHEVLHAFSRDEKDLGNHEYLTRSGYRTCFRSDWQMVDHNIGFNEGMTQLLTLYGIEKHFGEIKVIREKFYELMLQHQQMWEKSGDPQYESFGIGCKNTGWYRSYFREMRLVNAIIDLVAFERARYGGEIEEHKDDIWTDLVVGYFSGDFQLIRSILKEADSTGRLKKHIEEIQPGDILGKKVTDSIREYIRDIFDSSYRMSAIPTKLD